MTAVADFTPSALEFVWDESRGCFAHQYDRDLHVVAIWSTAREHEEAILAMVSDGFRVLAEFEVHWSADRVISNFERLYGVAVGGGSTKHEDAGTGPFLLLVVEDTDPIYLYRQNVSGYVELTNVRISDVKRAARATAGGYSVHSSNNIREFFRDATLLLGPDRLDGILSRGPAAATSAREILEEDLVGDRGWEQFGDVVDVLRRTSEYLVLRNFEDLPASLESDPEVDVLARDQLDFAAIVNGRPRDPGAGAAFLAQIAGREIAFDVRWVGDGYLDARWEDKMLARRTEAENGCAVPRTDDAFFSLLYHAKVQKPEVKPVYGPRLRDLATGLGLPLELAERVTEDAAAATVLDGFLSGHGFTVPRPVDAEVHRNDDFVGQLTLTTVAQEPLTIMRAQLWHSARHSRVGAWAAESDRLRAVVRWARRTTGRAPS